MNKFELEKIENDLKALEDLLTAMKEIFFGNSFNPKSFEMGFYHLIQFTGDIREKINILGGGKYEEKR